MLRKMKTIKTFEIEADTQFDTDDFELNSIRITDLEEDLENADSGHSIARIEILGDGGQKASFQLGFDEIDAIFDVLDHIRSKVKESDEIDTEKKE